MNEDRVIRYAALSVRAAKLERAGRAATGNEAEELLREALATRARMLEVARSGA